MSRKKTKKTPLILMVDDMPRNLQILGEFLGKQNYRISIASSGSQAFEMIKEEEPDLVLLDIMMPEMSGFEVCKILNTDYPDIPVIFLTAKTEPEDFINGFQIGAKDYITKPFNKEELLARVKAHLNIKKLTDQLKEKDAILEQRNFQLETVFDLMIHDTKNIFGNLDFLLTNREQHDFEFLKPFLRENITELQSTIIEASDYINSNKKIISLTNLFSTMKINNSRTLLVNHKRISIKYNWPGNYYINASLIIKNAIINVIENALKYSDNLIEISIYLENYFVCIEISDHGKGIKDEEKNKVFEKYFRSTEHKDIKGNGLGLYICKNIIDSENGIISVSDNKDGGAVFTIRIPHIKLEDDKDQITALSEKFAIDSKILTQRADNINTMITIEKPENTEIDSTILNAITINSLRDKLLSEQQKNERKEITNKLLNLKTLNDKGKRVIICDDSVYVHYYMGLFMTELGFKIVEFASNGEEAVTLYKKFKPDIITLDNTMPVMSGLEASKHIVEFNKDVKILFLSAVGDKADFVEQIENTLEKKNYKIITKPVKIEAIIDALSQLGFNTNDNEL